MSTKKIIAPILVLTLMASPFVAYAHSGNTDANGGHTDSSTGQYHYHNGGDSSGSGSPITGTTPAANNVANQVSSQTPANPESATATPTATSGQTNDNTAGNSNSAPQSSGGAKMSYKDVETKLTVVKHNWVNYNAYSQVKKEYQNQ